MKSKVNPAMIAVAAVVLIGLIFVLARTFLGGNPAQPPITADNAPEYVKQMRAGKRPTMYGGGTATGTSTPSNP